MDFIKKTAQVAAAATALLPPVGIPVRTVRAGTAARLATSDQVLAQFHLGLFPRRNDAIPLQLSPGEDQETAQIVLIELPYSVE